MTSPPAPAISVAMSVYNGERFLAEAIESVLGQRFDNFEFLILDDGSSDSTRDIISTYAAIDQRIRPIFRENRGLVASLNQLLAEAADDPNEPVKVAKTQQAQQVLMNALSELGRACERCVRHQADVWARSGLLAGRECSPPPFASPPSLLALSFFDTWSSRETAPLPEDFTTRLDTLTLERRLDEKSRAI